MSADYTYLADFAAALATIPPDTIVSRTLYADKHLKLILFGFAPGQELSEHTSARQATLHFLEGTARLTLGNDTMSATSGTYVVMPPHLPHRVLAETQVIMLLTMIEARAGTEERSNRTHSIQAEE
jgi:quercetin dioxygenase-like cupin family protein